MPKIDDVTINERATRTERHFTAHETTWADVLTHYQAGARIWLDMGDRHQAIRSMSLASHELGPTVRYTLRTPDGKHALYESDADTTVVWYQEQS